MKSRKTAAVAVFLVLIAAYFLMSRLLDSPEKRVRKAIRTAIEAVENGDALAFMSVISKNYNDELGLDYQMAFGVVMRTLNRWKDADVSIYDVEIEIQENVATTVFGVRAEATDAGTITPGGAPERPSYYKNRILVRFEKSDGKYLVVYSAGVDPKEWGVALD